MTQSSSIWRETGTRLSNLADGVMFDFDADGAAEQIAWTLAGSDDAFLVIDRNGNGQIDNGRELRALGFGLQALGR